MGGGEACMVGACRVRSCVTSGSRRLRAYSSETMKPVVLKKIKIELETIPQGSPTTVMPKLRHTILTKRNDHTYARPPRQAIGFDSNEPKGRTSAGTGRTSRRHRRNLVNTRLRCKLHTVIGMRAGWRTAAASPFPGPPRPGSYRRRRRCRGVPLAQVLTGGAAACAVPAEG